MSHLQEVLEGWWVHFLEFTGNQHGSYSDELILMTGNSAVAEVSVDQINCYVERFRL